MYPKKAQIITFKAINQDHYNVVQKRSQNRLGWINSGIRMDQYMKLL